MSNPITITLTFDTAAEAATTMLLLAGPKPAFKVEQIRPQPAAAQPAEASPAPSEPVAETPAPATTDAPAAPESHFKVPGRPRGRPRKTPEPATIDVAPTAVTVEPVSVTVKPVSVTVEPAPAVELQPEPVAAATVPATDIAPVVTVTSDIPVFADAKAVPSLPEVQAAIERLFAAKQSVATIATLQRFGVKRGRDLQESQRAEFIAYVEAVIAGSADPVGGSK